MDWIRRQYKNGASIYSACSGAVMLAETGLLDEWLLLAENSRWAVDY
jgi:transcriptional regulator GlxA family with amidase domain